VDLQSSWVNIEGRIGLVGIYGADTWQVVRRGERIGGHAIGNLLTDALCYQLETTPGPRCGPAVLLDNGTVILASVTSDATRRLGDQGVRALPVSGADAARAVLACGQDGRDYVLVANFGEAEAALTVSGLAGSWQDLANGKTHKATPALALSLPAGQACVLGETG